MFYSPFKQVESIFDIEKIKYEDLAILSEIKEGYSIEYKSQYTKDFKENKLPKSVCAFSNRNGGWLFLGVEDKGKVVDVPITTDLTKEGLFSIISSRVQPIPHVEISIIANPEREGYGVVVFYVNEGHQTPYISNGTVYVRDGNRSNPADRSTLDLLIKMGYDYSDISLKCIDADDASFDFSKAPRCKGDILNRIESRLLGIIQNCERVALYIQNDGRHFDENIEVTVKIPRIYYFDILDELKKCPDEAYEEMFNKFVSLPSTNEITEYLSPRLVGGFPFPPIQQPFGDDNDYKSKYMDFLYENQYYDFNIIKGKDYISIKIVFKSINPSQKMFFPAMLLCRDGLDRIEYTITSKYSMSLIKGVLSKG